MRGFYGLIVVGALAEVVEVGLREGRVGRLLRGGVVGEGAVDAGADGELRGYVFEAADVVGVDVRGEEVVEFGGGRVGEDVAGDPLAGAEGVVGVRGGGGVGGRVGYGAGVDEEGGGVGEDEQGAVAAAGVDLVDVEVAFGPGGEGLVELLVLGREWRGAGAREGREG